jgi:hypothetical protein
MSRLFSEGLGGNVGTPPSDEKLPPDHRCEGGCGTWLSKANRRGSKAKKVCYRCQARLEEDARDAEEEAYRARINASGKR